MKKMRFFAFVAVALFAMSFASCNKEDVTLSNLNGEDAYVVTPDRNTTAVNESYECPWCHQMIAPGEVCIHHYNVRPTHMHANTAHEFWTADPCNDPNCPKYGTTDEHYHVFDVCSWGMAIHWHQGAGTNTDHHHGH